MATREKLQNNFSGGEISSRMLLRHDLAVHSTALTQMLNWLPTLQGTAERAPGSQFLLDTGVPLHARIVPYRTTVGEKSVITLTENQIELNTTIIEQSSKFSANNGINFTKQIVVNADLGKGTGGEWEFDPPQYVGGSGDKLGMQWSGGNIRGNCRLYKYPSIDIETMDISTSGEIDVATDNLLLDYAILYSNFFTDGDFTLLVTVGTTPGGDEIYSKLWDKPHAPPPSSVTVSAPIPGGAFTGTVYMAIHVEAVASDGQPYSAPNINLNYFRIWANADAPVADTQLATTYLAEELADIHYVASPYDFGTPPTIQKPIIFVHPDHPPSWFYYDGGLAQYVFEAINFGTGGGYVIPEWVAGNYPSTCTAVLGRLVLGGTVKESETTWMTRVTEWNQFDDPADVTVNPDDSMKFTTIYRSPIQWLSGHKGLLVGTEELEYLAQADGIFQPNDLGVDVQTTHGGTHVQPAGFGQSVLFAAEGGHRVREAKYSNDDGGWVAPDLTLWHPDLFSSGIVRMVRMRNPHQMLVCVMGDGQMAFLHQDSYAQITGWSRITLNATVIDACVVVNDEGIDVLLVLVRRKVAGVSKLYMEAFADWTDFNSLEYLSSHAVRTFDTPTNVITGLDHLEGAVVQVVGDGNYLGSFTVTAGTVTILDQIGLPVNVLIAVVGRAMISTMATLPPPSYDPSSKKRYVDVSVRVRGSTSTIINGERVADRSPETLMNKSESLSFIADHKVANMGIDSTQIITIEERVPFRAEVLGIFGKIQEHSL